MNGSALSAEFKGLALGTRPDYESAPKFVSYPSNLGVPFGKLQVNKLRNHNFQRLVDRIESAGTPTKANKVLRYSRLVLRWALNQGIVNPNPARDLSRRSSVSVNDFLPMKPMPS